MAAQTRREKTQQLLLLLRRESLGGSLNLGKRANELILAPILDLIEKAPGLAAAATRITP